MGTVVDLDDAGVIKADHNLLRHGNSMSIDQATVRRVAQLARIALMDDEVPHLQVEINAVLSFVAELEAVDVSGVEPMTSVLPMRLKRRKDEITDGGMPSAIVANAATSEDNLFAVPKVIE